MVPSVSTSSAASSRYKYTVGGPNAGRPRASQKSRLVSASELGKMGRTRAQLDEAIVDALHRIDEHLRAHQHTTTGAQTVLYTMPSVIPIVGLGAEDARLVVYSKVIASLQERGFTVYHVNDNGRTVLHVIWEATIEEAELRSMRATLQATERCYDPTGAMTTVERRRVYDASGRKK